jgi:hypothetical protein
MSGIASRLAGLLVLAVLALVVTAATGADASSGRARLLGVVPHVGGTVQGARALPKVLGAATPATLTFDSSYVSLIDRYFMDVAHDSGGTQNVYSVGTQYYDTVSGPMQHVQYQSTFGGAYVDHDPLPPSGCDDANNGRHDPYCLTDQQLQDEIQHVLTAKGWQGGLSHVFFLMTPEGVGSCGDAVENQCSTNFFCAYHSAFGPSISQAIIYANEPYEGRVAGCSNSIDQGFPNDIDSDTTINTISHEHNEAITDPIGDGWIANDRNENGDLCAYIFGDPLGGTPRTNAYNQVINGHHYDLQEEYSNADHGCIQRPGGIASPPNVVEDLPYGGGPVMRTNTAYAIYWLPTPGNTTAPAVTGTVGVTHTLTSSTGSWNVPASGFAFQWQRCITAGAGCVDIPGATGSSYRLATADGGRYVRSTVSARNANGSSAYVASGSELVIPLLQLRKAPHISGRARIGRRLRTTKGSWSGTPKSYRFQWLRCNAHGGSCVRIGHATHPTYKLGKHDAKHRLRVRVTAANVAGRKSATSRATARVPAARP